MTMSTNSVTAESHKTLRLSHPASALLISMIVWTALAAAYSVYRGSTHDYPAYVVIWELIMDGGDPWLGSLQARNAYGPVNVVLAPLVLVQPLLPKIAMVTVFLVANMLVVWRVATQNFSGWRIALYALFIPLNGSVIIWGIAYGSNDILVAGLVGLALLLRLDERMAWTGVVLGLAVLLKLYPALLVLLFSIDRRSVSFRLLFSSGITVAAGLLIPFVVWGGNSLNWLLFAAERGSSQLSIWNQIINESWLTGIHSLADAAIDFNAVLLMVLLGTWLVVAWIRRVAWLPASIFGLLIVLVFYKVGHGQFWMTWLILACGLLITPGHRNLRLAVTALPVAIGASMFGFVYDTRRQLSLPWEPVQQQVGWIFFGLSLLTIVSFLLVLFKEQQKDSTPSAHVSGPPANTPS